MKLKLLSAQRLRVKSGSLWLVFMSRADRENQKANCGEGRSSTRVGTAAFSYAFDPAYPILYRYALPQHPPYLPSMRHALHFLCLGVPAGTRWFSGAHEQVWCIAGENIILL